MWETTWHAWNSICRVIPGVAAAIVIGTICGMIRSVLPLRCRRNPLIKLFLGAPMFVAPIAWKPFAVLWFGASEIVAIFLVFIGAFWFVFIGTYEALESVPENIREISSTLGIPQWSRLVQVDLLAALPAIITSWRRALMMGWMAVIIAEMVTLSSSGLGFDINLRETTLQYSAIAVDMGVIGLIGYLIYHGLIYLERRLLPWNRPLP